MVSPRRKRGIGARLLVSATVLASPHVARAQEANSGAAAAAQPPSVAAGEIIVTANRTESLASKTPISLSVLSKSDLRDQGISDATRLVDVVPNLAIDRVNGGGVQITMRGISSTDNSEKGDPSAAFLADGIYIARPQAQEVSLFDLDRVEILRGPQGTLYGRNTTAGLINAISARPKNVFEASGDLVFGNYNTLQTTAMVNVPLAEGAAIRAALNYNGRDNYVREAAGGPSLDPAKKDLSFRLSGKFDLSERAHLYVKGDYSSMKGNPQTGVALSNFFQMPITGPAAGQRGAEPVYRSGQSAADLQKLGFKQSSEATSDNSTAGLLAEMAVDLTDNLTATYLGAYRKFTRDEIQRGYVGLLTAGPFAGQYPLNATYNGDYEQQSHELRLAYQLDKLTAQAGLYFFKEESDVDFLLFGTRFFNPGQRGYVYGFSQHPTESKSLGIFGQATYNLTDALRLTAGIRQTRDDKSRIGATINHVNVGDPLDFSTGTLPGTTNPGSPATGFQPQRDSLNNASVSYRKTTWRLGVDYDLDASTLLFGAVSTGYKAGGFNEGCLAGAVNCTSPVPASALFYAPETLTSYEAGIKTRFANRKGRLSASFFHYDYSNLQLSQISATYCGGPCLITSNAGRAKVDGVELETNYQPIANGRIDFSATWLNARYTDYMVSPGVNLSGEKLDRSPSWVVGMGYQHTVALGEGNLVLGIRSRYSDSYHLISTGLRNFFRQPSFTKTDLTATYNAPGNRFYVQAYVKNVENKITISSASLSANFPGFTDGNIQFADPRTYGVRMGVTF